MLQDRLVQQYAAATAMLMQRQPRPSAHAPLQPVQQNMQQPGVTAAEHAQQFITGPFSSSSSVPPHSPADIGAWWLDDSTLHFLATFNRVDEPLVLTVDAEPVTVYFDEVSAKHMTLFKVQSAPCRH
jgi:hypothetical protein